MTNSPAFLRQVLLADAAVSGVTAALMIAGAGFLSGFLGLPKALLLEAGLILIPYVALVAWIATRERIPARSVWFIITCNAAWAMASVVLLFSGWIEPNALGYAFIAVQAVAVALFGELQVMALRKDARTA